MESWTPPKTGSPCWLQIEASDVGRGQFSVDPSLHECPQQNLDGQDCYICISLTIP